MKIGWTRCTPPALLALLLAALCAVACLMPQTPQPATIVDIQIDSVPNPQGARGVTIASVTDSRSFTAYAEDLSQHQVIMGNENDPFYTARLFGALRTTNKMMDLNYLLPEDRTVADLASTAVANGFRQAGFRVLDAGDPGFPDAIPVRADIKRFWLWLTPGAAFRVQPLQFEISVSIEAEVPPFQQPGEARGSVFLHSMGPPGFQQETLARGLEDFSNNLELQLREAATSSGAQDPAADPSQASPPPTQ